jgi:hypothetical protein
MLETLATMSEAKPIERSALIQAIKDLAQDKDAVLEDTPLAYELSHHLKPDIDLLSGLRSGSPEAIAEFQAEVEFREVGRSERTIGDLLADRDGENEEKGSPRRGKRLPPPDGPEPTLIDLPPLEQAHWIFMDRFISLEHHEEILGYSFSNDEFTKHQEQMDRFVRNLLLLPRTIELVENNDIQGLQKVFASSLLIFRNPSLADPEGHLVPSSAENLRQRFPRYFYKPRKKPYWFERQKFYNEPVSGPTWVLCETEFLNLTLRGADRRLIGYAKSWDLPNECAVQKSVVDEVYDRIISAEATGEGLFASNCNTVTSTFYPIRRGRSEKMVYMVQRSRKIAMYGKDGTPHWKANRRLWPGVYPTLVIP